MSTSGPPRPRVSGLFGACAVLLATACLVGEGLASGACCAPRPAVSKSWPIAASPEVRID